MPVIGLTHVTSWPAAGSQQGSLGRRGEAVEGEDVRLHLTHPAPALAASLRCRPELRGFGRVTFSSDCHILSVFVTSSVCLSSCYVLLRARLCIYSLRLSLAPFTAPVSPLHAFPAGARANVSAPADDSCWPTTSAAHLWESRPHGCAGLHAQARLCSTSHVTMLRLARQGAAGANTGTHIHGLQLAAVSPMGNFRFGRQY